MRKFNTKPCRIFKDEAEYIEKLRRQDECFADTHKRLFRCKVRVL